MGFLIYYIFIYLIEAFVLLQYASNLFYCKCHYRHPVLFCLLFLYTTLFFVTLLGYWSLNIIAFALGNFLFLLSMYHVIWYVAVFHALFTTIIMGLSELTSYNIMRYFVSDFFSYNTHLRNLIILAVLSKTIYFLIAYITSHLLNKKNGKEMPRCKSSLLFTSIPIVSLFVMVTLFAVCKDTDFSTHTDWMISISAVLLLISNLLIFVIDNYNQKKELAFTEIQLRLLKEQDATEYYKLLLKQNESQNILIHDIKKHLNVISVLNDKNEPAKIAEYINLLIQSPALKGNTHLCDREILDAILCRYQTRCNEKGVAFHTDIRSNTTDFITDTDMTSLFCNLLENALESSADINNAFIELSLNRRENTPYTVLVMTNSCEHNPFCEHGKKLITSKSDKQKHGFGMKSIKRIVEKYHGELQTYYDKTTKTFHTILTLRKAS